MAEIRELALTHITNCRLTLHTTHSGGIKIADQA